MDHFLRSSVFLSLSLSLSNIPSCTWLQGTLFARAYIIQVRSKLWKTMGKMVATCGGVSKQWVGEFEAYTENRARTASFGIHGLVHTRNLMAKC